MRIAIVGATGAVGEQIGRLLEQRKFPYRSLLRFASKRSNLEVLSESCFDNVDLAFFCAGSDVSKEWVPKALSSGAIVIDLSAAFRMDAKVPLVVPEINGHEISSDKKLYASPNCAATILLLPLFRLHRLYSIKRIIASTYQAASGAGYKLMKELQQETLACLEQRPYPHCLSVPYAFNLFLHNSGLHESLYCDEERKMLLEARKILSDPTIQLSATCVRVPVLRAHSISANVEFHRPFSLHEARETVASTPGLKLLEDFQTNRFPTPFDATGKDDVYCGRLRLDLSQPNTLELWCVGDQLLKGAALNAVQIAEHL